MMTEEQIAKIAKDTMGLFVGRLVNDDLLRAIAKRMRDATGCEVKCDAELNPPEQTANGVIQAYVTVPSGRLIVTMGKGETVRNE